MITLPKPKKPTLGQLVFGEITAPIEFEEDDDHPLKLERPKPDGMTAGNLLAEGRSPDTFVGGDGNDVLTGDAGDDAIGEHETADDDFPDAEKIIPRNKQLTRADLPTLYKSFQYDPPVNEWGRALEALGWGKKPGSPSIAELAEGARQTFHARSQTLGNYLRGRFDNLEDTSGNPIPLKPGFYGFDVGRNDGVDAFRHTLWSFTLAREIGPRRAKIWQDAHEKDKGGAGARLMDLYNNNIGHRLAMDPRNRNRDAVDVMMEALLQGKIRTQVFQFTDETTAKK